MSLSPIANAVIFKHLQNAVIVLNKHNQIVKLNLAAESLLAMTQVDAVGKDVNELFPHQSLLIEQFLDVDQINTEFSVEDKHFELHITPLQENGDWVGRVIMLHDITQRKETEFALKQQNERMALLYKITAVSHTPSAEQLQESLALSTRALGMELGIISHIEGLDYTVEYQFPPQHSPTKKVYALGMTYCSITLQAKQVVAIDHMKESIHHGHPCYVNSKLEAYIGTPILVNGMPYGTLNFSSRQPRPTPFQQVDKEFVDLLARWIGSVIEQQLSDLQLRANLTRTEALNHVAQSLIRYADLPDFMQIVTAGVANALPANRVILISLDMASEEVIHVIRGGIGADYARADISFSELQEGLTGWVLRESKPALSPKGISDPRESPSVQKRRAETNCGSIIVVPVRYHDEIIGTLTAINRPEDRNFNKDDVTLLEALASQTAVAIENMRLLTAERERAHQLQLSNDQLDAFSHMVAHDLKSPLALILGYVQLVLMDMSDPADTQAHLKLVFDAARKMRNIISELLLLASVRKEDVKKRPLAMTYIVKEALKRLAQLIESNQADIRFPEKWPVAIGYGPWVEEIWVNYISNAIKYGGEPPIIQLGADEPENDSITFWVKDNGSGPNTDNPAELFQEFTRLEQTRATGNGLGLSIVRQITEMLDGEVGFETLDDGAKFYFTLPIESPDND